MWRGEPPKIKSYNQIERNAYENQKIKKQEFPLVYFIENLRLYNPLLNVRKKLSCVLFTQLGLIQKGKIQGI